VTICSYQYISQIRQISEYILSDMILGIVYFGLVSAALCSSMSHRYMTYKLRFHYFVALQYLFSL
jgi:hypothetical protein